MSAAPREPVGANRSTVKVRRSGGVTEIRLDRPEAHNALSSKMLGELRTAFLKATTDHQVRAVVLSSTDPKAFCVGADLKERSRMSDEELIAQRPLLTGALGALRALPVPVIAAVAGYAVGGGYELALSCDVIVASEESVVGLPEVARGLIPGGGGTQLLQRRAGPGVAAELIYSARLLGAAEALQRGLVDRVVPEGSARPVAIELAQAIAKNSPLAVRSAKRAIDRGADVPLERALEIEEAAWRRVALSADRREGVLAFVEKREPVWPPSSDGL